MADNTDPLISLSDTEARILPPDYSLKTIVGEDVDLRQAMSAEVVEKVQQAIHQHKNSFLEWVKKDLETLEEYYRKASSHLATSGEDIQKLAKAAFVVKSQAGTFGFSLASQVARSLHDFCTQHFEPEPAHLLVIRKHIDTLSVIFDKNILGDGDALGKQLLGSLVQLVQKYKK